MLPFRYRHGDRPLDGFTIQRGVGRGGFGEVYYAISDSGREVALKVVQGYESIELRGVGQCMNLKSQHLVTIFDVKRNSDGIPFVIMEYVNGPSLRQLLDESPAGLSTQKVAFFLREIAKGLSYLHDCGIVHRDLKPGNIFYENGIVKIGDYGLSKAMSISQHSGQTVTVGTVHYMAPEIGVGKYDRSIDIYALGAMLFEMLSGTVPYIGASPAEVLMKHIASEPDVSGLEEPFATVVRKCMKKDPKDRYQTVQEVVEAVFGEEHVRNSVSVFRPESLSMVAQRVAQRIHAGGGSATPIPPLPPLNPPADSWQVAQPPPLPVNRINALAAAPQTALPTRSSFKFRPLYIWTAVLCLAIPFLAGALAYATDGQPRGAEEGVVIALCMGLSLLVLYALSRFIPFVRRRPFKGWWRGVYRPLAIWACLEMFAVAASALGNATNNDRFRGPELAVTWFLIIFPIVLIPVLLTIRFDRPEVSQSLGSDASRHAEALAAVKGDD